MSACVEATKPSIPVIAERRDPRSPLFSFKRTSWLTLVLLVAVILVAVIELSGLTEQVSPPDRAAAWKVCTLLVMSVVALLLLGRCIARRSLEHVEIRLRRLMCGDPGIEELDTCVPDVLKPVMGALNEYVALVYWRMRQICDQKRALDEQMRGVEAAKRGIEAIIHSLGEPVLAVDSQCRLTVANAAAGRLFGFQPADARGQAIVDLVKDAHLAALLADTRALGECRRYRQTECKIQMGESTRTYKMTISTVIDDSGTAQGQVAVFHDVTREREIDQLRTDFVSTVSHELRTPLSSIGAYVEMLLDGEAHSEVQRREFYRIIEGETQRLKRLVDNILNISRIEAGALPIHCEPVRVNDVALDVVNALAPQAEEKSLVLDFEAGEALPDLRADRDLLHQAVMNVVGNSIKYTPHGGRIRVTTALDREASRLTVTVTDNGIGIRTHDLPHVFDKFYRAKEIAGIAGGTGLGLSLVRHIVETVHHGEVCVSSKHGRGTTMSLRFPVVLPREECKS
ncbi:MAG TPA: ATP-binding protein [Phycisphaerae bacterium]|nr:ATP-binding protein [Phycisphaerae bacterium]HRR86072.1 ATP-binding protein [Phycisphaerae bacterium]